MRSRYSALRLPSSPSCSSSQCLHRPLHTTRLQYSEHAIFSSSLEKTLNAHRSANRASLIRKVIDDRPPTGIYRPVIPPEHRAGHELSRSQGLASDGIESQPTQASVPIKRMRKRPIPSENSDASHSRKILDHQLQFRVDETRSRPEQQPWLELMDPMHSPFDATSYLDAEIRALEKYLIPTSSEQKRIDQILADVGDLLTGIVPSPPQVIGSWRNQFALSHSDLDFVVPVPDSDRSVQDIRKPSATRPKMLTTYHKLLCQVEHALQQSPSFDGRVDILGNRSPVLTATHHPTGRRLRFYCGEGPPASIEYIMDYHAEYPSIRPLYATARLILEAQDSYGRHRSSIGSDALVMLLVAFLKMNHGRFRRPDCLGEQLLAFLRTYGTTVDLTTTGVAVDPPSWFTAASIKDAALRYASDDIPAHLRGQRSLINLKRTAAARRNLPAAARLCVQDPTNYMNDLGRGCLRTVDLQQALARAYDRLRDRLHRSETEDQGSSMSILTHALRANFDEFEALRSRMALAQ
ncbi:uncharacterized protein ACLA_033650 [Aspergillus clavatus NRRL 1]|uniref:Polynucleotide adenylyltransferase n=1 Tax=Aspergillus clavatus (strain ATCC 1007 / CBS 513.65 / DSM 816 / NCTC 3887 / NRRL 1 / QM 1276 / 107) TaxID=344612 RepID=A1CJ38_ASPCL|nr:uncharacterized protein ACLA_033650 [Aspergillus clavatus NRRL 1]EAW09162.1 conserved hypothetical protein [Aspergillus clavatus NRRL 1]